MNLRKAEYMPAGCNVNLPLQVDGFHSLYRE
jgi:hypothetical protein